LERSCWSGRTFARTRQKLRKFENLSSPAGGRSFEEALREASIGRVRPKLMTAMTAILGLLPLLVLRLHGTEIERPLAIVMTGGLITSTLFTLLVLPTFYLLVDRSRTRWRTRRAA
jgi:cobalt-zinc-cadmium resistance protein CzcA